MSILLNGDCLELMKDLDDNSVDLIFTDLPYGQVSCEWDVKIDFAQMWAEFMRIKKERTPIFFCCSTKFGVEIINSAPKKCPFRYDIVWVKSAPCGFLSARKMPMKKHEMLYVFYEKLPFYDLSSHKHKFKKEAPDLQSRKKHIRAYGELYQRRVRARRLIRVSMTHRSPCQSLRKAEPISISTERLRIWIIIISKARWGTPFMSHSSLPLSLKSSHSEANTPRRSQRI